MRDLPERPSVEHYRHEAKELVRAHRVGDAAVRERAAAAGTRSDRFVLADAQLVLAREHGFRSWAGFRRALERSPLAALAEQDLGEVVVDSGLVYGDGETVRVLVRKRLHRYSFTDQGRAVAKAGKPAGWREAAELAVEPMNLDRQGVVFVPVTAGRDLEDVLRRLADASRAVHEAVIVLVD